VLILISDASNAGLQTLLRLHELANEMEMEYKKLVLLVNRMREEKLPERISEIKELTGADIVVGLPYDETVARYAEENISMLNIPTDNPVYIKTKELLIGVES
jgi:CO dehydrogenase maturation factor